MRSPLHCPIRVLLSLLCLAGASPVHAQSSEDVVWRFSTDDSLTRLREVIQHNGYRFTVSTNWVYNMPKEKKARFFSRHASRGESPPSRPLPTSFEARLDAGDLEPQFCWTNVNGASFIGPIRDQGDCGSCYAFAACAAAEGVYNVATGQSGPASVDFSESFLMWGLGSLDGYQEHFWGCDGADYDYYELEALTRDGIADEAQYPYTTDANVSIEITNAARTVFSSWHRLPCGDINAIKTAIRLYGPVDAAVMVTAAFQAYAGGIYEDDYTECPGDPCSHSTTDHAVVLVGWDETDGPENGCWILRNSWGPGWGEQGYMRIRYHAARVACATACLVYEQPANIPPAAPVGETPRPTDNRMSAIGDGRWHDVSDNLRDSPSILLDVNGAATITLWAAFDQPQQFTIAPAGSAAAAQLDSELLGERAPDQRLDPFAERKLARDGVPPDLRTLLTARYLYRVDIAVPPLRATESRFTMRGSSAPVNAIARAMMPETPTRGAGHADIGPSSDKAPAGQKWPAHMEPLP